MPNRKDGTHPGGRDDRQFVEYRADILEWIRQNGFQTYGGATKKELCEHFHISLQTFDNFRGRHPDFVDEIARAKEFYKGSLARRATKSLIALAEGAEVSETTTEFKVGAKGEPAISKQVKRVKKNAPDFNAVQMILTNVASDEWQRGGKIEVEGNIGVEAITGITVI